MKKKLIAAALVVASLSLLAGCNKKADYSKYVTLGDMTGLEYTAVDTSVSDEDVQAQIDQVRAQGANYQEVKDRATKNGDVINLDYVGSIDGVEFEGGSTKGNGTTLTVGSSGYIDNFDEQLVGRKVGEKFDVCVTFPENYGKEELNGKAAVFACTLNSIQEAILPDYTDEWVTANTDYANKVDYEESIRMTLETQNEAEAETQKQTELIEAAVAASTITSVPQDEVDKLVEDSLQTAKDTATSYNIDFVQFINYYYGCATEEDFKNWLNDSALKYQKQYMVVNEIARQQGIEASKNDIETYAKNLASQYGLSSVDEVYNTYSQEDIEYLIIFEDVCKYLEANAVAK